MKPKISVLLSAMAVLLGLSLVLVACEEAISDGSNELLGQAEEQLAPENGGEYGRPGEFNRQQEQACITRCQWLGQQVLRECVESGESRSVCSRRAQETTDQCLREHCRPTGHEDPAEADLLPLPPQVNQCVERCRLQVAEQIEACLEEGFPMEVCALEVRESLARCVQAFCSEATPPSPSACHQACARRGAEIYRHCMDNGGEHRICMQRARRETAYCVKTVCLDSDDPEYVPSPNVCEYACRQRGRLILAQCLEDGGHPMDCQERSRLVVEDCVSYCLTDTDSEGGEDGGTPSPSACHFACEQRGEHIFRLCMENGGEPRLCRERARAEMAECVETVCLGQEGDGSSQGASVCEQACRDRGRHILGQCLEAGGHPQDCHYRAELVVEDCVSACFPDCGMMCRERSESIYQQCVEAGGDPALCARRARDFGGDCLETHCAPEDGNAPPPPAACEQECDGRVRLAYQACIESDGDLESCVSMAIQLMAQCLEDSCVPATVDPDHQEFDACFAACEDLAQDAEERCLQAGGPRVQELCALQAEALLVECGRSCAALNPAQ